MLAHWACQGEEGACRGEGGLGEAEGEEIGGRPCIICIIDSRPAGINGLNGLN